MLRYGLYIAASLLLMFIGYLLTIPLTEGYQRADAAVQALPALQAELRDAASEREGLLLAQEAAVERTNAARLARAQADSALEDARQIRDAAVDLRIDAIQRATERRSVLVTEGSALEQTLDLGLGEMPNSPEEFGPWLTNADQRAMERCSLGPQVMGWEGAQSYVVGNLSGACAQREVLFDRLRSANAAWSAAHVAFARVDRNLGAATSALDSQRERLAEILPLEVEATEEMRGLERDVAAVDSRVAELEQRAAESERLARTTSGWVISMRSHYSTYETWLWDQWSQFWRWALAALFTIWVAPYVYRGLMFYAVAPVTMRASPLQLSDEPAPDEEAPQVTLTWTPSERTSRVTLSPNERMFVRPNHLRQVPTGFSRTRWLLESEGWGFSWLLGFFGWTEVAIPEDYSPSKLAAEPSAITLAATDRNAADTYLMRVDLENHPGMVIQPQHVVAMTSGLTLFARWRFGLHALMMGQLRYIQVRGTGSIWMEGFGDVSADAAHDWESHQDRGAFVAWDSRMRVRLRRRETAWPYVLGQVELYEMGLHGEGAFVWQKAVAPTGQTLIGRTTGAFWSAAGKVLGF